MLQPRNVKCHEIGNGILIVHSIIKKSRQEHRPITDAEFAEIEVHYGRLLKHLYIQPAPEQG
jgi:hypothetical protein